MAMTFSLGQRNASDAKTEIPKGSNERNDGDPYQVSNDRQEERGGGEEPFAICPRKSLLPCKPKEGRKERNLNGEGSRKEGMGR